MRLRKLRYDGKRFLGDLSGGVIAALIALPYGLAMAALMGLPPVLGLFTSLLTAPVTALLGRNPVLIGGTASATVPFVAAAVQQQGLGGAAKVSIVAAVFMLVFSVMKLGRYITKVPFSVVSGFSCGIGAMMIINQLRPMFGVTGKVNSASPLMSQLADFLAHLDTARWEPLLLAVIVIVVSVLLARIYPKAPAPLIGISLAVLMTRFLGLHEREVGFLTLEMPPFAGFSWTPADVLSFLPSGFALAFVASVNILITSRVVEHFRGRHMPLKRMDADAELGAYGIANVCAAMFGAPISVGIPARSLANVRCGGTTRISNLIHAAVLALILLWGSGILAHIPLAALAGVTAWMGFCLLDWSTWRRLHKMRRVDAVSFLSTALAVLLVNAVAAVAAGCLVHIAEAVYRRFKTAAVLPELQPETHE